MSSFIENQILRSTTPIELEEAEEIDVFGERGTWANKQEVLNWKGPIPIQDYKLNEDSNPEKIVKTCNIPIEYSQNITVKYLKPPTPYMQSNRRRGAQLSSTYPLAPMDYVNMYTNENIKSGKAPPPPPIIKDNYTCFGKPIDPNDVLIRPLETQGLKRLYSTGNTTTPLATSPSGSTRISTNNHKRELKKLNHSIVIAYLDLLEILIKAPTKQVARDQQQQLDMNSEQLAYKTLRDQKLEDIELLFINMHHLINELRPHQARDNIRCILEMQKRQRIETAQKFKTHLFKIVEILKLCIQSIQSPNTNSSSTNTNSKSDVYIDELNELMSNAHKLTKSLDSIDLISNNNNKKSKLIDECNTNQTDVDMIQEDDLAIKNTNTSTDSINFNKNITTKPGESSQEIEASTATAQQATASACDYKDLILCDLIDDFLLKENEF